MLKKMMLLAIASFALVAFATPALAQAQQLYTLNEEEEHVPLAENAEVVVTTINTGFVYSVSSLAEFSCFPTMLGVMVENQSTISRIGNNDNNGGVFLKECQRLKRMTIKEFTINEEGTGLITDMFYELGKGALEGCWWNGNVPLSYEHGTNTLTIVPGTRIYGCGYSELEGSFELFELDWESEGMGSPVYIE